LRVNFQFLQKTPFKSPRSGADYLYTNIETMCSEKLNECASKSSKKINKMNITHNLTANPLNFIIGNRDAKQ